jgi:Putative MetA-pathway of phenol degradation
MTVLITARLIGPWSYRRSSRLRAAFRPLNSERIVSRFWPALGALLLATSATLQAQDLEPRAYSNSPIGLNFAIAGYAYAKGDVLIDPSLPLENVSNDSHVGVFGFATTFRAFSQSGKFDFIVPYAALSAKGLVNGLPHERYVNGFADPAFRVSVNFIGAPALTVAEFKNYRQDFICGASMRVTAPLGQYDSDKLVNIGTNRWSFKPEIGCSKAFGRWTTELAPAATFYTDNGNFFGGQTRNVAPLYSLQSNVSYTFTPGGWVALNAAYFVGSRSTVNDLENDDQQEGMRFGATIALPINRYQSVKLYGITGYNAHRHHDFAAVGVAWQVRWGGGY